MKFPRISLALFVLSHFANLSLHSQQNNFHLEDITSKLDIVGAYINKVEQDHHGYLWIACNDGLIRYDGYTSLKYRYKPFDIHSVSQTMIYTFFIDKSDTIWVGTPEGLCKFDRNSETFTRYSTSLVPGMPDLGNVGAINEDDQGNLWIGNYEGKLWRYNKEKGTFLALTSTLFDYRQKTMATVFHDELHFIHKDRTGTIWIGNNTGLHRLNTKPGKSGEDPKFSFTHYQYDSAGLNSISSNDVTCINQDQEGIYWIGTFKGLNRFDARSGIFSHFLADGSTPLSTSGQIISSIKEDKEGNLWIGTENGLNKFNITRTSIAKWFDDKQAALGAQQIGVYALELDAGGNLFINTSFSVLLLNLNQKAFGLLRNRPGENSLSDNSVSALAEDNEGIIWVGNSTAGLNKWNKQTGTITHFKHEPANNTSLRTNFVTAILKDPNGDIWVANTEFLSRLKKGTSIFEHFNSNSRKLDNFDAKCIYCLCRDKDGLIWMGTGNGIKSFDPVTKKFTHYFYELGNPYGISDYTVLGILADSRGNIWVGNNSIAFNKFDKRTGRFTHYKNNALDSSTISSNIVNCVFEDSKRNLWVGTLGGGLCQYDYATDKFTTHTGNKDIPWSSIFSIQEDNKGNLWLGTERGLSCYDVINKSFTNYDSRDGLQGDFFAGGYYRVVGSSARGKDGFLYFGGINGLNYFDPASILPNAFIPPIVITQFKIFDKLQPGKNESGEIILNHDQNFFSFEFAALNYTNTAKNQFAYQLEGFDHDWVYSGSRRYASYTNLNPGKYTFKVKASNNDGVWNEKGIAFKVIIRPPWWKTWWAYSFYGLCLLAGIIAADRIQRHRVLQKQREESRKKELAHAKEIEKAYHELKVTQSRLVQQEKMASLGELTAGIAHEIQNPLNFVNNFAEVNIELIDEMHQEIDKGNTQEVKSIANDIRENEQKISHHGKRADAIVKGMLQHSRSSNGIKESTNLNALADEYLRLVYHGLRAKDNTFHVTIRTEFDDQVASMPLVTQDIGRVLLNLYSNAFYAVDEKRKSAFAGASARASASANASADKSAGSSTAPYEPTVSVSTKKINDKVAITITDNGSGIPGKVLDKIFQPFFTTKPTGQGTGLGLSMAYDIIKAHGGELKVTTQENEGASFIIELPVA